MKRKLIRTVCTNCGKKIKKRKFLIDSCENHFCSNECHYEYRKKTSGSKYIPCANCGELVWVRKSRMEKSKSGNIFCSRSCSAAFNNTKYKSGENHPSYINGISVYRNKIDEDDWSCVDCGENRKYLLIVHHIDGDRKNNDPDNHEVVCFNHHALRHLKRKNGKWVFYSRALTPRDKLKELLKTECNSAE